MPIGIGQRITEVFTLVTPTVDNGYPDCTDTKHDCMYKNIVLADGTADLLKNDKTSWLVMGGSWTSAIAFFIEKENETTHIWTEVATYSSTYGEDFDLGYWTAKPKYSGMIAYWRLIYNAFGVGNYRFRCEITGSPFGVETRYSQEYCLRAYTCNIHNSVRFEWYLNKGIGDIDNDKNILDYSTINWYSQLRIEGAIFGYPTSTYEDEEIQYTNGEIYDLAHNQEEKYTLTLPALPATLHNIIKTYALQSDKLLITDYGKNNPQQIVQKQVKRTSGYEPRWNKVSKCAPVTVDFKPVYNRLSKWRCL